MTTTEAYHELSLDCLRLKQPLGEFFVCKISAKDLCAITHFDIRRMLGDREIDEYIGIQRHVDGRRVVELQQYVNTLDACFPTSIVLAVDQDNALYDAEKGKLTLSNNPNPDEGEAVYYRGIARVIDGQHRIEGLKGLSEDAEDFEVTVSIFVGLDIEDQAYIFATVNLAQTKVNKSLVYDLYDFAKLRSPQRTCHNIVIALDRRTDGPFHNRIKRLGSATYGRANEMLTQAAFVEALMPYISPFPSKDRDDVKRGRALSKIDRKTAEKLIFRNLFVAERDKDIALILYNYFSAVQQRWPNAWTSNARGQVLGKTNGFKALMRFLRYAYQVFLPKSEVPTQNQFYQIFTKIKLEEKDLTVDNYAPGSGGEAELFYTLLNQSGLLPDSVNLRSR